MHMRAMVEVQAADFVPQKTIRGLKASKFEARIALTTEVSTPTKQGRHTHYRHVESCIVVCGLI